MTSRGLREAGGRLFPMTRASAILALRSADPNERARSRQILALAYWKPVYKYLRLKWHKSNHEAEDLTQAFFAKAFEADFFGAYDPERARFRTFIRLCLDRFVMKANEADRCLKRGGGGQWDLAFDEAEREIAQSKAPDDFEAAFDQELVRSVFAISIDTLATSLQACGKRKHFDVFERYQLCEADRPPSYAEVAAALGLSVTDVTNYLAFARRELRQIVLETLRELTGSDEEFRSEARAILGIEA